MKRRWGKLTKIGLYLVDGLGFEFVERSPGIAKAMSEFAPRIGPLKTNLGFSLSILPSIWTSCKPVAHGKFAQWSLSSTNTHNERHLSIARWRLETLRAYAFSRLVGRGLKTVMPNALRDSFVDESTRPLGVVVSLEDTLAQNGIRMGKEQVGSGDQVTVRYFGHLDSVAHRAGIKSNRYLEALRDILGSVRQESAGEDLTLLFSDHGTTDVGQYADILKKLSHLPLTLGKDYLVFLDATICRLWFFSQVAREIITKELGEFGHFVTEAEKKEWGLDFGDKRYGDSFLVVSPGTEIYPNFYHPLYKGYMKAVHGYLPSERESFGVLACNLTPNVTEPAIYDIAPTVVRYLGLSTPKDWIGRSFL